MYLDRKKVKRPMTLARDSFTQTGRDSNNNVTKRCHQLFNKLLLWLTWYYSHLLLIVDFIINKIGEKKQWLFFKFMRTAECVVTACSLFHK